MSLIALTIVSIIVLGLVFFLIASFWKVFKKAGKPGWAAIIPLYNGWTMAKIGSVPPWWGIIGFLSLTFSYSSNGTSTVSNTILTASFILSLISLVFFVLVSLGVARNFNKSAAFGYLMGFVPMIGYPILAFGSATYKKPKAKKKSK